MQGVQTMKDNEPRNQTTPHARLSWGLYAVGVLVGAAVTTIAVGLVLLILIDAKLPPHP